MKQIPLLSLLLIIFVFEAYSHQNPFRRPARPSASQQDSTRKTAAGPKNAPSDANNSVRSRLWKHLPFGRPILTGQRVLTGKLSSVLRSIKADPRPSTFAVLLTFAFLYGIIHSLGPGHAKTLFASHGLSRRSSRRNTWIAATIFSLTHTGSAVILFTVVKLLSGTGRGEQELFTHDMMVLSGILIIVAGSIIMTSSFLERKARKAAGTVLRRSTSLPAVAVMAGLAPCPGAFLILTFSHIIGILPVGIAAVAAVSLGMAITVSLAGIAGSSIGNTLSTGKNSLILQKIGSLIRFPAAGMIIAVGILMLLG